VAQPGKQLVDRLDDQNRTIAILDIGAVHLGPNQQSASIGHNVSLAPLTFLAASPGSRLAQSFRRKYGVYPSEMLRERRFTLEG
jgi:hypothetical protein